MKTCVNVTFWWTFWLHMLLKNFLWIETWCSRYLKGAPRLGLYNGTLLPNKWSGKNIINRKMKQLIFYPRTVYKHKINHHLPQSKDIFQLKKLKIISRKAIPFRNRSTTHVSSMPTVCGNARFHDSRLNIDSLRMGWSWDCPCWQ